MIKITKLEKNFNKGKINHVHVVNNTSLELPEKGLVTLLGNSGSGKTTLLNVIGGLDSVESGTIDFDGVKISKYKAKTWDKIRANDIGCIFQNYHLLHNKTVKENIEFVLTMIGVVDSVEVEHRISYVLKAVSMYRFRNKLAGELSGGQQQRVAIARAIVKNPKVIIADEPTGNLDSKNSLEVMRIIKKISEERLVLLVTHESELASHYADRIIEIVDGKVIDDVQNINREALEYQYDDRNLYLGDLNKIDTNSPYFELYSDNPSSQENFKLKVVSINGVHYLETSSNMSIRVLNDKSELKILEGTRSDNDKVTNQVTEFSLHELESKNQPRVKKRTISLKEGVISAFRKLTNLGRKAKFQIFSLILLGILLGAATHTFMSTLLPDYSVITSNKNLYTNILIGDSNIDRFRKLRSEMEDHGIVYYTSAPSTRSVMFMFASDRNFYLQSYECIPTSVLTSKDVIYGKYPTNKFEALIDEHFLAVEQLAVDFHVNGIKNAKQLIGEKVEYQGVMFTISGVVSRKSCDIYFDQQIIQKTNREVESIDIITPEQLELVEGNFPSPNLQTQILECVITDDYTAHQIGDIIYSALYNGSEMFQLKIVGRIKATQETKQLNSQVFVSTKSTETLYFSSTRKIVYSEKDAITQEIFARLGSNYINTYNSEEMRIEEENKIGLISSLTTILVLIVVSCILFYFLVRSSLTSRIKEISILRSLGVNRREVTSVYLLEYFIITTFTSLIGLIIGTIGVLVIKDSLFGDIFVINVSFMSTALGFILVYVSNIIIGLIPVFLLLRKTPAKLLTNSDI